MQLVVQCSSCAHQYGTDHEKVGDLFLCSCGQILEIRAPHAHDAAIVRCSACGGTRQHSEASCTFCQASFTIHERDLHTMCGACLSRISQEARFCHHCGTRVHKESLLCSATQHQCQVCPGSPALRQRHFGATGVATLECHHCAGIWVGHETFEHLAGLHQGQAHTAVPAVRPQRSSAFKQPGPMYRRCVQCQKLMTRHNYQGSGIIIDICPSHGIWFDAHELGDIMRFLQHSGAPDITVPRPNTDKNPAPVMIVNAPRQDEGTLLATIVRIGVDLLRW